MVIEFRQVSYRLPPAAAKGPSLDERRILLRGLNLQVQAGERLMLLGRSGSGKTTTLKLINRLLEPSEGVILVDGRPAAEWDPIRLRRSLGYVIQEVGLFPHFNVERNVGLVPALEGWAPERVRARTREMLELAGLNPNEFAGRFPHQLSGGQRQRVGVARALAADPPVLLMDEPFGALDPITRMEIQREFRGLMERLKKTVVFVTHDVREAFMLGTRIALMEEGGLVACGTPEEVRRTEHPVAKLFMECWS